MRTVFLIIALLSFSTVFSQNRSVIDSLLNELPGSRDTIRVYVLYNLYCEYATSDRDTASIYIEGAIKEALKTGDSLAIAKTYYGRAWLAQYHEDYEAALPDYENALDISLRNNLDKWSAYILNDLSLLHTSIANYDKALDYNFQSLELRKKRGDLTQISIALSNIGLVYLNLDDFENGIRYYEKSYGLRIQNNITYYLESTLINIGYCYIGLHDYEKAIRYFLKAQKSCDGKCSDIENLTLYNGLAETQLALGRYKDAEETLELSLNYPTPNISAKFRSRALNILAKVYADQGKLENALYYLNQAYELLQGTDLKEELLDNYELYASIYREMHEFQKASEYQQNYIELKAEILNGDLIKNISRIQVDYEERENIKTITSKNELLALKEVQASQQKVIILVSVALAILLLVVSIILWKGMQIRKKMNAMLDNKVRERTAELEQSYNQIQRISFQQQQSIDRLNQKIHTRIATLRGITQVAKLDVNDPKGLSYISRIEEEAEKFRDS